LIREFYTDNIIKKWNGFRLCAIDGSKLILPTHSKELMDKLEIGKVKMTRLLDKLEAKQFIIRKRRGMNNIVVLKEE